MLVGGAAVGRGVKVAVGVSVGVVVAVGVDVAVAVGVSVGVKVAVAVGVAVGVKVTVAVGVGLAKTCARARAIGSLAFRAAGNSGCMAHNISTASKAIRRGAQMRRRGCVSGNGIARAVMVVVGGGGDGGVGVSFDRRCIAQASPLRARLLFGLIRSARFR